MNAAYNVLPVILVKRDVLALREMFLRETKKLVYICGFDFVVQMQRTIYRKKLLFG